MRSKEILAVDVSHHQGKIDWQKVRQAGIGYALIRAGYGKTTLDKQFERNIQGAADAGICIGVYWYSYAISEKEAKAEARRCVKALEAYRDIVKMPVFFDSEYEAREKATTAGESDFPGLYNRMALAFCAEIAKAGYRPGVYYNEDYHRYVADQDALAHLPKWLAVYKTDNPFECAIWQYTDKGRVDGIETAVDMNRILDAGIVKEHTAAPYKVKVCSAPWRLNVREKPETGRKIGAAWDGQRFEVNKEQDGWGQIEFAEGVFGWIDLKYTERVG